MKRISVFAFYDGDGVVDRYIEYMLQSMKKCVDYQIVVVNGTVKDEYRHMLTADEVIYRDNAGFDVSAYKQVFCDKYDEINSYDEILFFNQTIFGPITSFEEVFAKTDAENVDFWGMTMHPGIADDVPDWLVGYDHMPRHLQSYFLGFRKGAFPHLLQFFNQMPEVKSYYDAVGYFEIPMTSYMRDRGLKYKSYIDTSEYRQYGDYAMIENGINTIKNLHGPVIKRKAFITGSTEVPLITKEYSRFDLLSYIKHNSDYDVNMIVENLVRTCDARTIMEDFSPYLVFQAEGDFVPKKVLYIVRKCPATMPAINELIDAKIKAITQKGAQVVITDCGVKEYIESNHIEYGKYDYCCAVDCNYDQIYDRFMPYEQLCTDIEMLFDMDTNLSIMENNTYIGAVSPTSGKIGEMLFMDKYNDPVYRYGYYLGNCFIKSDILAKSRLSDIPQRCLDCGMLPSVAISKKTLAGDYMYTRKLLDKYADLSHIDDIKRFDQAYVLLQHKISHYEQHHNDMTLRQAYNAKLPLKDKLFIIWHLLFNKDE